MKDSQNSIKKTDEQRPKDKMCQISLLHLSLFPAYYASLTTVFFFFLFSFISCSVFFFSTIFILYCFCFLYLALTISSFASSLSLSFGEIIHSFILSNFSPVYTDQFLSGRGFGGIQSSSPSPSSIFVGLSATLSFSLCHCVHFWVCLFCHHLPFLSPLSIFLPFYLLLHFPLCFPSKTRTRNQFQ